MEKDDLRVLLLLFIGLAGVLAILGAFIVIMSHLVQNTTTTIITAPK